MPQYKLVPVLDVKRGYWDWQELGNCVSADPELFYLDDNLRGKPKRLKETAAKKVCNGCPVKTQCLEHALTTPEMYGIWGGTSEKERKHLALRRRS